MLFSVAFYQIWSTFLDKNSKANPKRKTPAKSQFFFTKEGEIIEVVDEKRKRGGQDKENFTP